MPRAPGPAMPPVRAVMPSLRSASRPRDVRRSFFPEAARSASLRRELLLLMGGGGVRGAYPNALLSSTPPPVSSRSPRQEGRAVCVPGGREAAAGSHPPPPSRRPTPRESPEGVPRGRAGSGGAPLGRVPARRCAPRREGSAARSPLPPPATGCSERSCFLFFSLVSFFSFHFFLSFFKLANEIQRRSLLF